jgi:RNA polymerase-binding transcription factor DksA
MTDVPVPDDIPARPAPPPGLAVLEQVEAELAGVQTALERLDSGQYGLCEACGQAIGDDLLAADPLRRLCGAHAPSAPVGG